MNYIAKFLFYVINSSKFIKKYLIGKCIVSSEIREY